MTILNVLFFSLGFVSLFLFLKLQQFILIFEKKIIHTASKKSENGDIISELLFRDFDVNRKIVCFS